MALIASLCLTTVNAFESEGELELFEKTCINGKEISIDLIVPDSNKSCEEFAFYLQEKLNEADSEVSAKLDEATMQAAPVCDPDGDDLESQEVNNLIEEANIITARVACEKEEVEANKKICGKLFQCNVMRSISSATDTILPEMLSRKVDSALAYKVASGNLPADCLDKSRGDCLTEVVTAFVGNLWSTVTSVWDVVKSGASSLFNVSSWFDKKSETAHEAAVQTKDDVKKFSSDPAGFIVDKFNGMTKMVDDWVKSSVFCQKWDGVPHLSNCKIPLQNYDCIDCDHKINATCAAIGTLTSEVGLLVMTAGVGNVASITARVGARALALAAREAAINIKRVTPGLNIGKTVTKSEKVKKVVGTVSKAAVATKDVTIATYKMIQNGKEVVANYMTKLSDLKIVRSTLHVVDVVTNPLGSSQALSRVGVNMSNQVLAKVGTVTAQRHARIALRMDKHYGNRKIVTTVIDKRDDHALRNSSIKGSRIAKELTPGQSFHHPSSSNKPAGNKPATSANGGSSRRENTIVNNDKERIAPPEGNKKNQQAPGDSQLNVKVEQTQKKGSSTSTSTSTVSDHKKDQDKSKGVSLGGANALGALAIADTMSKIKVSSAEAEQSRQEKIFEKQIQEAKEAAALKTKEEFAKEALGAESISKMKKNAEKLSEIYEDSNKEKMVEQLVKNTGVTREVASQIFDKRKDEVIQAKKYVDEIGRTGKAVTAKTTDLNKDFSMADELKKMSSAAKEVKNKKTFDRLDDQREELEARLKSLDSKLKNGDVKQSSIVQSSPRTSNSSASPRSSSSRTVASVSSRAGSGIANGGAGSNNLTSSDVSSATPSQSENDFDLLKSSKNKIEIVALEEAKQEKIDGVAPDEAKAIIKYQTSAIKNLLKVVNLENVDLVNDAALDSVLVSTNGKLDNVYVEKFNNYLSKKTLAKYKITKTMSENKKIDVYEFENGEQFSVLTESGASKLISNEDSEGYFR